MTAPLRDYLGRIIGTEGTVVATDVELAAAGGGAGELVPAASFLYAPIGGTQLTDGVVTTATYLMIHPVVTAGGGLVLEYWNPGADPITIKAGIETPGAFAPQHLVTFAGSYTKQLVPGGRCWSDPAGVTVKPGDRLAVRTNVSVTAGQRWMLGERNWGGAGKGGAVVGGDVAHSGSLPESGSFLFGPVGIHLQHAEQRPRSVVLIGDSHLGIWGAEAFEGFAPAKYLNRNGEALSSFVTSARKFGAYGTMTGHRTAVEGYGTNDFQNGWTADQVKTARVNIWRELALMGKRAIAVTVVPRTTSTDAWATTANQAFAAAQKSHRDELNRWLRAGAPLNATTKAPVAVGTAGAIVAGQTGHPLHSYVFDYAALVESAPYSGLWKPGYTTDGIHVGTAKRTEVGAAFDRTQLL